MSLASLNNTEVTVSGGNANGTSRRKKGNLSEICRKGRDLSGDGSQELQALRPPPVFSS